MTEICECGHSYGDHWESTNAEREGGCSICECKKFKAKKEICENCGQVNHPNPLCQKFKPKNQSRFQNHINVIKCATRLRDIDNTRHGSESLSDKIVSEIAIRTFKEDSGKSWIEDKKVKEFIKDLKDRINEMDNSSEYEPDVDAKVIIEEIDKLAGKGLTNG